jgi:hypothetical protein
MNPEDYYLDTYFFNPNSALEISKQNNLVETTNPRTPGLQICYYNADEPLIDAPENCIFVPLENVYNYFVTTKNRIPKNMDFSNTTYQHTEQLQIKETFDNILRTSLVEKENLIQLYAKEIQKIKPDFSEKPWRVFIPCCRETTVMQYISKNIAKTFESLGYEVFISTQDNAMQSCLEILPLLHNMYTFKPHITVNINHFVNEVLHDDVFNFVWFQDPMPSIMDDSHIDIRKRDHIFHLSSMLNRALEAKNIKSTYQPFCLDENIYIERKEIKRERKIVFIGSSYKDRLTKLKKGKNFKVLYNDILTRFKEKGCLTNLSIDQSDIKYFMDKYNKPKLFIDEIYAYIGRDYCVEYLCQLKTDYEIEIYGFGWEKNKIVSPYYKGVLSHGEEISRKYNEAEYGFCPGGYVLMQRTLECAFSGAIPLVSEVRADKDDIYDPKIEDSLQFFTINTLEQILKKETQERDFSLIKSQYSYKHFIKEIEQIIDNEIQNRL